MIEGIIKALGRWISPLTGTPAAQGAYAMVQVERALPSPPAASSPNESRLSLSFDAEGAVEVYPDPVIVLAAGCIVTLNAAAQRLLGGEAVGSPLVKHVAGADRHRLEAALRAQRPEYLSFALARADGGVVSLNALLLPGAQGTPHSHVIVARPLAGGAVESLSLAMPEQAAEPLALEISRALSVAPPQCFYDTLSTELGRVGRAWGAARGFIAANAELEQRHGFAGLGWLAATGERSEAPWLGRRKPWLWNALRDGRLVLRRESAAAEERELLAATGAEVATVVPLLVEGRLVGALVLESTDARVDWERRPRRQLESIGEIVGSALVRHLRERELADERSRLLEAQALAGLGYWDWTPQSDRLECSASALRIFAAGPVENAGRQWLLARVHSQERARLDAGLQALLHEGRPFDAEYRLAGEAGETAWVRLQARLTGAGAEARVRGNVLDITPSKRREQEVLTANARFEHLIDSAPIVVYVLRADQERELPLFVSDNAERLFGYQRAEMLAPGWWEGCIHEADVGATLRARRQLALEGHYSAEYRLRDAAGEYRWIYDEATVLHDAQGLPREVVGLWLDITDKRRSEAAVRESESRYRALVEDSPTLICGLGPDLRLEFVNGTAAEYFEAEPDGLRGRSWLDFIYPDDRGEYLERVHRLTPEAPLSSYELRVVLPSGEVRWQFWSDRAFFRNDELIEIRTVGRDTTELREARAQLAHAAKMATIGALATGVAHELNQPLNVMRLAIQNIVNRAAAGKLDPEFVRGKLERIERQVGRASNIVDQMRMFGRKSSKTPAPFDPGAPVDGALELLREQLNKHKVDVEWRPRPGARRALGFSDQVEQVIINLMVNARDAINSRREREGDLPGRIQVELEDNPAADQLVLVVRDNGGGIPAAVMEKVFDPFFTTKEVGKGTGLGLSLSFGMLQDMGGGISVRNTDEGAEFRMVLPVAEADGDTPLLLETSKAAAE